MRGVGRSSGLIGAVVVLAACSSSSDCRQKANECSTSFECQRTGGDSWECVKASSSTVAGVRGERGPPGPEGPQGPKGQQGETVVASLLQLREEGHRALVYSQFTKLLDLASEALDEVGVSHLRLDGSTPAAERRKRVESFQAGEATVFLLSLKAGGMGLNLTAADYVLHLDPWWNPAAEDQASDRAHRIGQARPVTVYRFVTRGTIEEEILSLHEAKRALVNEVLEGTDTAGRVSTEELLALIRGG